MLTGIRSARAKSRRELVAAALAALFVAVVYSLAVWTRFGQEMENALLWPDDPVPTLPLGSAPVALPESRATAPEPPTVVILPTGQAALWCGLLLLVPLVRGKTRLALWGLVTLAGSAATAVVLKSVLPRPLLDLSAGLSAENSAPSGHATMATSLALVALVVCPAAFRYLAASAGVAVAVLTAYFVQTASWHRPSDILMAAAVSLLWAFLAAALVPAGEDIAPERWNLPALSLCVLAVTVAALWWASGSVVSPGYPVIASAAAPCAAAVLLAHHRFADRPRRAHTAFSAPSRLMAKNAGAASGECQQRLRVSLAFGALAFVEPLRGGAAAEADDSGEVEGAEQAAVVAARAVEVAAGASGVARTGGTATSASSSCMNPADDLADVVLHSDRVASPHLGRVVAEL